MLHYKYGPSFVLLFTLLFPSITGDLEPTFSRCCHLGVNWGQEGLQCASFPAPVTGIPAEQQAVCLSTVQICCLRKHRERQCEAGKLSAKADKECRITRETGGEFHRDCCEGCKLGLVAGTMAMGCGFRSFKFGTPWDEAYLSCCQQILPQSSFNTQPPSRPGNHGPRLPGPTHPPAPAPTHFSATVPTPRPEEPAGQDLCALFPNELCAQICVPTPNSYRCECREGFNLLADGKSCQQTTQADRCALNNPCSQKCIDTGLAIECACNPGYQLGSDLRTCHDVDECNLGSDNCDPLTQICINEPGSFRCVSSEGGARGRSASGSLAGSGNVGGARGSQDSGRCPPGFRFNFQSRVCDDIDECVNPRACPTPSSCQNTIGSFTCVRVPVEECRPGYRFDLALRTCVDIDECENPDTCPRTKPLCINTPGSFVCQWREPIIPSAANSCPAGYKYNTLLQSCEDVDECAERLHACNPDQEMCVNEQGKYRCDRIEPVNAESDDDPNCPSGYVYDEDEFVCLDLDECLEAAMQEKLLCKQDERCVNTEGAYECVAGCPKGFQADPIETERCVDVDECTTQGSSRACTLAERCINTIGSYRCESLRPTLHTSTASSVIAATTPAPTPTPTPTPRHGRTTTISRVANNGTVRGEIDCPLGYKKDANGRCKDINECVEGNHTCKRGEEDCVNALGSYRCKPLSPCLHGFKRDTTTAKCIDVDECTENKHNCPSTALCVNQYGSFVCRPFPPCPPGHRYNVEARYCQDIDECAESVHNCTSGTQACINAVGAFRCVDREPTCSYGYRYNTTQNQCVDVDECAESRSRCATDQDCVNTPGSYQCVTRTTTTVAPSTTTTAPHSKERCQDGYRYNRRSKSCLDIDECTEDRDVCSRARERCVNEPGGYRCVPLPPPTTSTTTTTTTTATPPPPPPTRAQTAPPPPPPQVPHSRNCHSGHRYDNPSRRCVDINECAESNPCRGNQQCENTVGSYVCRCGIGFRFNDRTQQCDDINECSSQTHECLPSQRCDNTVGSYSCVRITSCGTGYTFNSGTGECEDDDECALGTDNCLRLGQNFICRNTQGSFRCERRVCEPGFKLDITNKCSPIICFDGFTLGPRDQCVDIDECARNPCSSNQRCINTVGSYSCQDVPRTTECGRGYEFSDAERRCVDVDECAKGTHDCRRGQTCQNKPGGYDCTCPQGYQLKDGSCVDFDECEHFGGSQLCGNHQCINTPGSYRCDCKEGFRTQGQSCVDIDECSETPRLCQHNCVNNWGSYQCICEAGYTLNADNRSCQDIDECEQYRERGLCNGLCVNKPGSYACSCPDGYRLSSDGRTCQDIDECATGNRCQRDEICLNTRGGYHCNSIVCPTNYVRDQEHRNYLEREDSVHCKKQCHTRDYRCLVNNTQTITYQFIALPTIRVLEKPMVLTKMQAVTVGGGWSYKVTFDILSGNDVGYFGIVQDRKNFGSLQLMKPLIGPKVIKVKIQMNVVVAFNIATKHLALVDIYVSANEF